MGRKTIYADLIHQANFINGKWEKKAESGYLEILEKFDQFTIAEIPWASDSQIEDAVQGAIKARKELKSWSAERRSGLLNKLAEMVLSQKEAFAQLIVHEAGKPLSYARTEIDRACTTLKASAREALNLSGEAINIDLDAGKGKKAWVKPFPIHPVVCITPFNFPLNLLLHKIAPALAVGTTAVVKPSVQSPLSALALAKMIDEVGFPKGSVSVLMAKNELAESLVRHPEMGMLSFTGSDKVGWKLKSLSGKKKVCLELGGNAAALVDETNSNLEEIASELAYAGNLYAGQICISTQRIYVVESVFEVFKNHLIQALKGVKSGNPLDSDVVNGPLISRIHLNRIQEWVDEAKSQGAEVLFGGGVLDAEHNVFQPTLITHTRRGMKVVDEEVFGPVLILEPVDNFEAGLAAINDSRYGLQAGVFTEIQERVNQAHEELEVGGVIMNGSPGFRVDTMPYGGVKDSGLGREGVKYAMEEMTEPRLLVY